MQQLAREVAVELYDLLRGELFDIVDHQAAQRFSVQVIVYSRVIL